MKRRWLIGREQALGGHKPRGWRLAWYEPLRRVGVYFPIPAHVLARALREIAWRVRHAAALPSREVAEKTEAERAYRERLHLAEKYAEGYLHGWRECFETCLELMEEESARGVWKQ